ncbi:MAG: serine hydrolase [Qipengyuania sp.]
MIWKLAAGFVLAAGILAPPLNAQESDVIELEDSANQELRERAGQVVGLINGTIPPDVVFSESFLAAIPPEQFEAVGQQLTSQFGQALRVERLEPVSATRAGLTIRMERALGRGGFAISADAPYKITELLLQSFEPFDDSAEKIAGDIAALPGRKAAYFGRLDGSDPLISINRGEQLAIGSTFKLYVLAALDRAVRDGRLRWDETVPLGRGRSFPSGIMQEWPEGAPVTLHTLATLMISISDNTATDILIDILGREAVEQEMRRTGHSDPARNIPFLKTREFFVLKAGETGERFAQADEAGRAQILAELDLEKVEEQAVVSAFNSGQPRLIDNVEWFASMSDLRSLANALAKPQDNTARGIMAVSPSLGKGWEETWDYAGYKGGSEPGVLNLTWLLRDRAGDWHLLALSWNDAQAPLENTALELIAQRMLALPR